MSDGPCPFEPEVLVLADGEMDPTRRIVVEAHLGLCSSCADIEDAVSLIDEIVATTSVAPLGAAEIALARLPEARPRLRPFALAAAAAALIFVGVRYGDGDGDASTRTVRPVAPTPDIARVEPPASPADPPTSPETAAEPALPAIPAPLPPAGPTLRRRLAAFDVSAPDAAERAREIAADIRRRGPRSARALAEVLATGTDLLPEALEVAGHVQTPPVTAALGRMVDHPLYGDVAARALAAGHDRAAVPSLLRHLDGAGSTAARDALAEIGGRDAARGLVERLWNSPPPVRAPLLDAAVRADPAVGGAACLEALGTSAAESDGEESFAAVARVVVTERADLLLPFLRRTARGRDTLRARLAVRGLGWAGDTESRELLVSLSRTPRTAGAATAALLDLATPQTVADAVAAARLGGDDGAAARAFAGRFIAEPPLIRIALRGDDAERRTALTLLRRCGGSATAAALGAADFPRGLQAEVVATLAAIGGAEAADALAPLASVPGLELDVIVALGATASPRAVPILVRIADDAPRRRVQVVASLQRINDPAAVTALVDLLRDERAGPAALDALALLPAGRVVPPLLDHCGDRVPVAVRRALARIAGRDLGSSPAPWREWWAART